MTHPVPEPRATPESRPCPQCGRPLGPFDRLVAEELARLCSVYVRPTAHRTEVYEDITRAVDTLSHARYRCDAAGYRYFLARIAAICRRAAEDLGDSEKADMHIDLSIQD